MNIKAVLDAQRAFKRKPEELLVVCNRAFLEEATREFNLQWYASTPPRLAGMEIKRDDTIESFVVMVKDQSKPEIPQAEGPKSSLFHTERIMAQKVHLRKLGSSDDQLNVRMTPAFFEIIAKENGIDPNSPEPPKVLNMLIVIDPNMKPEDFRMIDHRPRFSKKDLYGRK